MIDPRLIKPAAALVMAGAAIVACTVGQSAFAASTPAARTPAGQAGPAGGTLSAGSRPAARSSWSGRLTRPAAEHIRDTQAGR